MSRLNSLPSVEKILQTERAGNLAGTFGRPLTLEAIRSTLAEIRRNLVADPATEAPQTEAVLAGAEARLSAWTIPSLRPVVNATGVILHTNLGRAPLSTAAIASMAEIARGYSNLEFSLDTGRRGDRGLHVESVAKLVTGAEAAFVVNNNAAAVLLVLSALAARRGVIIARSQLVEIGGGFRMPEVMRQSGAKLVEVGTTNKVRLSDYEAQFSEAVAVVHVHRSNFKLIGFTSEPALEDIADAAHRAGLIVLDDLGSGALLDTAAYGLAHEPTVQESIASGADLVCFSGDKLVGGPQSGIIVGRSGLVDRVKRHPLARAVRADKACLAALSTTLSQYLLDEAEHEVPVWRMISASVDACKVRAENWAHVIGVGEVRQSESTLGGGSLPGESMPSYVLALSVRKPGEFLKALRMQTPPIVARTEKDNVLFDPRTVLPEHDEIVINGVKAALTETR